MTLGVGLLAGRGESLRFDGRFTFPGIGRVVVRSASPSLTVAEPRRTFTGFPVMPIVGHPEQGGLYSIGNPGRSRNGQLSCRLAQRFVTGIMRVYVQSICRLFVCFRCWRFR